MGRSYKKNLEEALKREHKCPPPTLVEPPYGHECAVCGEIVAKGHPLHRADQPDRSAVKLIAAWELAFEGQSRGYGIWPGAA